MLLLEAASCAASAAAVICSRPSRPSCSWSGVKLLRAPAEPAALQLTDQEPQLLDLGLGRVTLPANEVALRANRIQLSQNSIAFDLESSVSRALGGDDFSHMPQMM